MSAIALLAAGVLYGTVTFAPATPVCRAGTSCSRPAIDTQLTFTRRGRSISTRSNGHGRYRLELPTGTWYLDAGIGRHLTPAHVTVHRGRHHVDLTIDTGIR